ncbi:hypothetical protein [Mycobacterium sp. OAE908]|uniref:hypothetical protein n=1 Tax=Mycobacterium sp. OAE908 TaxID=2817899 RepID=UPI001AEAA6A6
MTPTNKITASLQLATSAGLLAATFAFGLGGLGDAALAYAEGDDRGTGSDVLDMEAYEACMNKTVRNAVECCLQAGGIPGNPATGDRDRCFAPAGKPASMGPRRVPLRVIPGDAPELTPSHDPSVVAVAPVG